jgi:hypothetical protein
VEQSIGERRLDSHDRCHPGRAAEMTDPDPVQRYPTADVALYRMRRRA